MKYIIFVLLLITATQVTFAQSAQNNEEKKFPNIPVSPSPKAYEMAKYVEFPRVDNYGLVPIDTCSSGYVVSSHRLVAIYPEVIFDCNRRLTGSDPR